MRRVHITTFGCQMNKLDSELVVEALLSGGYSVVADEAQADILLMNTCAVRDQAENRVLSRLGTLRARKKSTPNLLIGVMGCMAQRLGEDILKRFPHVDLVCGTKEFPNLPELLVSAEKSQVLAIDRKIDLRVDGAGGGAHARRRHQGTSAFVSAMRGCNYVCSYCIVPKTRGKEVSRPVVDIVEEVKNLVGQGAVEITLLGQTIDAYGKEFSSSLAALLRAVHEVDGLKRLRFITSHPCEIDDELMRTMHDLPRVGNYLHMPAQSGNNRILTAMRRRYTREIYLDKLERLRRYAPAVQVSSDFIVGFPSETVEEFEDTKTLIQQAGFGSCFVFKYSPRPGTTAAKLRDDVPFAEKQRRNAVLLATQEAIQIPRKHAQIGSRQEILVEGVSPRDPSRLLGRTSAGEIVVFPGPENPASLVGELVMVAIKNSTALTLYGFAEGVVPARRDDTLLTSDDKAADCKRPPTATTTFTQSPATSLPILD